MPTLWRHFFFIKWSIKYLNYCKTTTTFLVFLSQIMYYNDPRNLFIIKRIRRCFDICELTIFCCSIALKDLLNDILYFSFVVFQRQSRETNCYFHVWLCFSLGIWWRKTVKIGIIGFTSGFSEIEIYEYTAVSFTLWYSLAYKANMQESWQNQTLHSKFMSIWMSKKYFQ